MKFLCVKCDQGMQLKEVSGPDEAGSLAALFRCAGCSHEFAMLTNGFETQLVSSLGVKLGPEGKIASKCPFTALVHGKVNAATPPLKDPAPVGSGLSWTEPAAERLSRIPEFVRPMVKSGIEDYARTKGIELIDEGVLDQARQAMGQ